MGVSLSYGQSVKDEHCNVSGCMERARHGAGHRTARLFNFQHSAAAPLCRFRGSGVACLPTICQRYHFIPAERGVF
jgi:hypothetical protein